MQYTARHVIMLNSIRKPQKLSLRKAIYMDNYLDSVESTERALIRSKKLVNLLHLGGFKLTKFVSNVPDLDD